MAAAVVFASACDEHLPNEIVTARPVDAGDSASRALESPPSTIAPEKRKDDASSPVVFDPERGGVWTANGDVGTVSYVDVDARAVIQEIPIGKDVRSVALSPDARWGAAIDREGGAVVLVDAETRAVRKTIALGAHPRAAVWDAWDPRWLYVALEDDDAVALVDRSFGRLVRKISVGRLPAGLAVSRARHELAVVHRIDAKVTIVSLAGVYTPADQRLAPEVIALEDAPENDDATVPQGRPFAFESIAWAPDGTTVWVPHQLITTRQPFQFQTTIFPAVSVLDVAGRAEIKNDPAAPDMFLGRKTLFSAINVIDATGNTSIVSQPCAARIHPRGIRAYALACGSEDFLTFDATTGVAVDLLRDLPGDHPVGLALDDTGTRAFVFADQSKTLSVLDLADGSPLHHVSLKGEPIHLVAKDPVETELREGLKLFFRANSNKGTLATTGNNWMSCGACHLDGFVSTNLVFFEALKVPSQAENGQIGHVGLKDLFSTAPTPQDPSFDAHDVLVAFVDQGGLAPDRTGKKRDGAIDPLAPSAEARQMAARIARVIARDLPAGPSWLLFGADKPDVEKDGAWCGNCHKAEFEAWKKSAHAHAGEDPMVRFGVGIEQKARGPQYSRLCAGCHEPVSVRIGDSSLSSGRGITCVGCHDTTRMIRAGGNADSEVSTHDWTKDHKTWASASLEILRKPEFCGGCHQQFVPATGLEAISTLHEWKSSRYNGYQGETTPCVDCHMPKSDGQTAGVKMPIADHASVGGNVWLAGRYGDEAFVDRVRRKVRSAITLKAARGGAIIVANIYNKGAGHAFPTGVVDIREPWLELQALDAQKNVLARWGGPGADGLLPPNAMRLGFDIAKQDGTLLFLHELSETTRIPFERRVAAQLDADVVFPTPETPVGTAELDVVLYYRNVRTPYFRAATGDPTSSAPDVEVARAEVK